MRDVLAALFDTGREARAAPRGVGCAGRRTAPRRSRRLRAVSRSLETVVNARVRQRGCERLLRNSTPRKRRPEVSRVVRCVGPSALGVKCSLRPEVEAELRLDGGGGRPLRLRLRVVLAVEVRREDVHGLVVDFLILFILQLLELLERAGLLEDAAVDVVPALGVLALLSLLQVLGERLQR